MKILMILSNPLMVDPRVHKEAKALIDSGNEICVIVWDRKKEYSEKEDYQGIKLFRIHNEGFMKIVHGDLLRNPIWWRRAYRKAVDLYKDGFCFDVVHCHDLDTLKTGVWLKKRFGCKLVYDAHEIFGYMIEETKPGFICKAAFYMEKKLVKFVDYIITVDEPFKKYFSSISDKPIQIVMNCKDLVYKGYTPTGNKVFTLVYIGIMTRGRFFPDILDVVEELDNVKLVLAGKKEGLFFEIERYAEKVKKVDFLGTIPSDRILPLTRDGDATFVLVEPGSMQHKKTVFNKQFEAMVCGRPIIVTKGTYAAKMTEDLDCGLTVDFDKDSVRKAIITLRDNPQLCKKLGRNALKAAEERYNWEIEKKNLLKVYEELK